MATQTQIFDICDFCEKEAPEKSGEILSHTVVVDRIGVEIDACKTCWKKVTKGTDLAFEAGRRIKVPRQSVA